mmetsp:Transcript_3502/g.8849  ORF Transcript_3502/g.8849 Transcript_3502/m.8849 type:complete len:90 (-) Transcript_3502:423-692(-)
MSTRESLRPAPTITIAERGGTCPLSNIVADYETLHDPLGLPAMSSEVNWGGGVVNGAGSATTAGVTGQTDNPSTLALCCLSSPFPPFKP